MELTPRLIIRNTLLNLAGQVVPLLAALVSIPYVIRGLGPERFGLLSLAWVVLGYFTVFDLGLSRATTKYVAELIGRGEEQRIPEVLWASVACQLVLGILGGVALFFVSPLLVERALQMAPELVGEARRTFAVLSAGVPIVLVTSSLYGALEARQRFDVVNAIRVPANLGTYVLPVVGVLLEADVPRMLLLVLLWRALAAGVLGWMNGRALSWRAARLHATQVRELLRFGSWVTVSGVLSPLLAYLDKFALGALVSLEAVGHYAAPYEAISRLTIVPASLVAVLFPAFSTLSADGERQASGALLVRSGRIIGAVLAPVVLVVVVFAPEIMAVWLGEEFARHSAAALQVLALGVFVNSLAYAPYALVQAVGRPDLTAKFHLLELPFCGAAALILITRLGVVGAALTWALRVLLDTILLFAAAVRMTGGPIPVDTKRRVVLSVAGLVGIGVTTGWLWALMAGGGLVVAWILATALLVAGFWIVWRTLLEESDRRLLVSAVKAL